jgi:3-oxoacyl-[acyl-carrier protein] reductase
MIASSPVASLLSHSDPAPRLLGRTALVTGAARGIGLAISRRLRAEGAAVALLDLDGEALAVAAAELGGEGDEIATAICDVRDSAAVDAAVASAARALGSLDVIVNNAGLARDGRLGEMSDDDWDLVLEVDLRGAFYCSRAAAPYLAKSEAARIVNISSRAHLGNPGQANYSAAKAGVIGMTRALSLELGRDRITVNAVAPGMIDTDLVRSHPKSDAIVARAEKATPLGRIGTPAEVAAVVAFLASDDAAYVSGEVIHVTGGR